MRSPWPYPKEAALRLSDAFEEAGFLGLPEKVALELEVRVLNINGGRNAEVVGRCKTLAQYSVFIDRAQAFTEGLEKGRGEAINNLLAYGMTPEQISQALQLPPETVLWYQAR
jgi:hypothetical protein